MTSEYMLLHCNTSRYRLPVCLPSLTFQTDCGLIKGAGVPQVPYYFCQWRKQGGGGRWRLKEVQRTPPKHSAYAERCRDDTEILSLVVVRQRKQLKLCSSMNLPRPFSTRGLNRKSQTQKSSMRVQSVSFGQEM